PTVRVRRSYEPQLGDGIIGSALEASGEPGGDAKGSQHDGHCGGEIFAMALLAGEKKISQGVGDLTARQLERVAIAGAQMVLDGARALQVCGVAGRDVAGELRDARIERGELDVTLALGKREDR